MAGKKTARKIVAAKVEAKDGEGRSMIVDLHQAVLLQKWNEGDQEPGGWEDIDAKKMIDFARQPPGTTYRVVTEHAEVLQFSVREPEAVTPPPFLELIDRRDP